MTVSDEQISAMLNEELLERRTKVMFLRNAGATWSTIAKETGVSEITARRDYSVVCRDLNNEQPADVIGRHRAVIFDIQRANYPAMMRGDKDAAATILRALDREAKLLGLDAPTKVLAGVSDIEFANEAARLIERIQSLDPATLKELERANHTQSTIIDADVEPPTGDRQHVESADGAALDDGQTRPDGAATQDTDPASAGHPTQHLGVVPGPAGDPSVDDDDDWSNID